ncbi:unnamed protein product [Paramecium pentaurelia]|uniref:Transmembrane protein n=1 Tax=Paramecium pentaurelia TaxID=43138 RepID=A0A8S1X5C2_9CILI|nr:unnamed protein product [Paramecium pentaurelia]
MTFLNYEIQIQFLNLIIQMPPNIQQSNYFILTATLLLMCYYLNQPLTLYIYHNISLNNHLNLQTLNIIINTLNSSTLILIYFNQFFINFYILTYLYTQISICFTIIFFTILFLTITKIFFNISLNSSIFNNKIRKHYLIIFSINITSSLFLLLFRITLSLTQFQYNLINIKIMENMLSY